MAKDKATPPRRTTKYVWIPEGTYVYCDFWYTLWLSARPTRREAREEMATRQKIYDFDKYRVAKFERVEGGTQ